jgi:hypothetical protein
LLLFHGAFASPRGVAPFRLARCPRQLPEAFSEPLGAFGRPVLFSREPPPFGGGIAAAAGFGCLPRKLPLTLRQLTRVQLKVAHRAALVVRRPAVHRPLERP